MSQEPIGARFFDDRKRDRGWATSVVRRQNSLGKLTVLDVTTTDAGLLSFLGALDRSAISVEESGTGAATYRFVWASGYDNGPTVRVQGVVEGFWAPAADGSRTT